MEFLKELATDWILFSLVEGFIYVWYVGDIKNKKFLILNVGIVSIFNCLISKLFLPIFYQLIMIIFMVFYFTILDKYNNLKFKVSFNSIKKLIVNILLCMFVMVICETPIIFIFEIFFNINPININSFEMFLILLPSKIIEILFIKYWK